jgi:hypothetical protein
MHNISEVSEKVGTVLCDVPCFLDPSLSSWRQAIGLDYIVGRDEFEKTEWESRPILFRNRVEKSRTIFVAYNSFPPSILPFCTCEIISIDKQ